MYKPRMPRARTDAEMGQRAVCTVCDVADIIGCHPEQVCAEVQSLMVERRALLRKVKMLQDSLAAVYQGGP